MSDFSNFSDNDPVRVTEEVSTFTESDVVVTNTNTTEFSTSPAVSRNADSSSFSVSARRGLVINPNQDIGGVVFTVSDNTSGITLAAIEDSSGTVLTEKTGLSLTANDSITLFAPLSSGNDYRLILSANGSSYTNGFENGITYPITGSSFDIVAGFDGSQQVTDTAHNINDVQSKTPLNHIELSSASASGDVLISFDSGSPVDIDSYDLATFQRTLDSETVTIDVEDSNGNVLKSDIDKDTDISDIATTTDVQLRANLSRNNTSNNPKIDYLARRFTR